MTAFANDTELWAALDDRTRALLERRGSTRGLKSRGWLVRRALLTADVVGLTVAFALAQHLYGPQAREDGALGGWGELLVFLISLPAWVVAAKFYGLYDRDEERADHSTVEDSAGIFHLVTVCTFLLFAISLLTKWFNPPFTKLFVFWFIAIASVMLARFGARAFCRRQPHYLQNTVIVGAGDVGQVVARKLLKHPEYGLNLLGFVDGDARERMPGLERLNVLGDQQDVLYLVRLLAIDRVIIAFSSHTDDEVADLVRELSRLSVQVDVVPRLFDVISPGIEIRTVEGLPICSLPPARLSRSSLLIKRALDLAGASLGLLVVAPVFLAAAVAIRIDSPGPVFFRQYRTGEREQIFRIWKFRTMVQDADERKHEYAHLNKHLAPGGDPRMFKIDDDPRETRLGRWLRRTSLDELPQLINVLAGEMSLVGPRPLILDEMRHVNGWAQRRLDLRPGMTGLWQVLGRDGIGFEEMVRLDYVYVTNWSLSGDLALLAKTIPVLMRGREIN